jgi:glycosyltransferase involved in cell wall biosynthesis
MAPHQHKHILIICHSDLTRDARVRRQVEALRELYTVSTAAYKPSGLENGSYFRLPADTMDLGYQAVQRMMVSAVSRARRSIGRSLGLHHAAYWTSVRRHAARKLRMLPVDLVLANDLDTLPMALRIARKRSAKVLFDAHEYFPGQHEEDQRWMAREQPGILQLCRTLMPLADHCLTVSPPIADLYHDLTGVRPTIITNAPAFNDLRPSPVGNSGIIRLVHHGVALRKRRTDDLIAMMDLLGDGYELHLFLLTGGRDEAYMTQLREAAALRTNVHWHAGVPPAELPRTINQFDIGVHALPPVNTNHDLALPNKLFDFIQARLAVVVSPGPAMADLVRSRDIGVVAEDHGPEAMANAVRGLAPEDIARHKLNAHGHARSLSSEGNMDVLRTIVRDLLAG